MAYKGLENNDTNPAKPQAVHDNPMQTDGFEFVEFSAPNSQILEDLFQKMGFSAIAHHKSKDVILYRQGQINFIVNREKNSFSENFSNEHGPCASGMAFRVHNAAEAHRRALSLGSEDHPSSAKSGELIIPAIKGIGGSALYFVDKYTRDTIYNHDFVPYKGIDQHPQGNGLTYIDHLTHNVFQGRMDHWADFYINLFNFRQIRYFDIKGQKTGLISRAMISPCNKIIIPINESEDEKSQITEYLKEYKGEGIQHIALGTNDIVKSVGTIKSNGVPFMEVPTTYYDVINERLADHGIDLEPLKPLHILVDGEIAEDHYEYLLQIFTNTVIGPIFFEIIQRKGHQGFGEGNFTALFEAMERDQMERGVL